MQRAPDASHVPQQPLSPDSERQLRALTSGGEPLQPREREFFEPQLGRNLSDVRVHHDSSAQEAAQTIHAEAFVGSHIAFGAGHWSPQTSSGRHLIAHELAHVKQSARADGGGGANPGGVPNYLTPPPGISGAVVAASSRVTAADTFEQWRTAAEDVNRLGNGLATLVSASVPATDENLVGLKYLEELDVRLAEFEGQHQLSFRVPAVFPLDRTVKERGPNGETLTAPESIPWQFYLINTGVSSFDRPATSGGEWVLVDLTSGQRFENKAPASDLDSAMLQQGAIVDPPLDMFSKLNSRMRFPEGRLYFKLPSGKDYVLKTTEPGSLSDWLSAIGMALTAIALIAGVIATGGAASPAAIAVYAGVGAGRLDRHGRRSGLYFHRHRSNFHGDSRFRPISADALAG